MTTALRNAHPLMISLTGHGLVLLILAALFLLNLQPHSRAVDITIVENPKVRAASRDFDPA